MNGDYYNTLGITKDAQNEDVAKAFRKMALKYHPELTESSNSGAFAQVAESYDVLSNPKLRARYDEYGEDGLKYGKEGDVYTFTANPDAIFKEFFGVANPFQVIGNSAGGMKHLFFSKDQGVARNPPQPPPIHTTAKCTLEEVFSGASRAVTVPTDKIEQNMDGENVVSSHGESVIAFEIEKGLPDGSRLKFVGKGSQHSANPVRGDVYITTELMPHTHFSWKGDDLVYTHKVTLEEALCGFSIEVQTLGMKPDFYRLIYIADNRKLSVFINDVVHPQYTKVIKGEGMPVYQKKGMWGDLIMRFETTFPAYLTEGQKKEVSRIFNSNAGKA